MKYTIRLGHGIAILAALVMLASLLHILLLLKDEQDVIESEFKESLLWHAAQQLHQTDEFHRQLTDYQYGNGNITRDELLLRFDLLWSRMLTLSNGDVGKVYVSTKEAQDAVAYGREMLTKLEDMLEHFQVGDQKNYDEMSAVLLKGQGLFRAAMLAATRQDQEQAVQRRARYNELFHHSIYVLVIALACALGLIGLLFRNQFALHDLNTSLDAHIEKRTLQLASNNKNLHLEIAERAHAEEELRKLSAAIEQSPVSVAILERNGNLSYVNAKFILQTGLSSRELLGQEIEKLDNITFSGSDRRQLSKAIQNGENWNGEYQIQNKHGDEFWVDARLSPIRNQEGESTHFLLIEEDVSLRKQHEKRLRHQAFYDDITRLPNRVLAMDRLSQAIASAQRHKHRTALLLIDLDQFKQINDTLGHFAGDQLLRAAGERLSNCLREEDTVARLGGDEFTVILPNIDIPENVEQVSQKLLEAFSKPFTILGQEVFTTASVGITLYPDDATDTETMMRHADAAMYEVKDSGRNAYRFYTETLNNRINDRMRTETHLRRALERGEFSVHYQPIIEISSSRVTGAEALLRWNNPVLGDVRPDQFINIAEDIGVINDIGAWVLRTACEAAAYWQKLCPYDFHIAVNASSRQFSKSNELVEKVQAILTECGLAKDCLDIEVTESLMLDSSAENLSTLEQLTDIGVRLSIDDFGTGYSSLSYVKNYPFAKLKIDRSFVKDITQDTGDAALTRAILAMAHSLNLQVVGEGVETAEQLEFLREHHCTFAQGFYFSPALNEAEFENYLRTNLKSNGYLPQISSKHH